MSNSDKDFSEIIEDAKIKYNEYASSQKDFECPKANIKIENELDENTNVYINVEYKGTEFYFKSIEENDTDDIHKYLNSQPLVREKYSDGNIISFESTKTRIETLSNRFKNKNSPLYLYSGFVVYDYQTDTFLGMANIGAGPTTGIAEIAFLNRIECWSHSNNINQKCYSGVGTVEVSTLLQYAQLLKQKNYLINGHILQSIIACARIDNIGSWKSCAKVGMTIDNIQIINRYGDNLRYQLKIDV